MNHRSSANPIPLAPALCLMMILLLPVAGCQQRRYDPERATRAYPIELKSDRVIDAQVFRRGPRLEIHNATAHTYREVDVWVNQRFVQRVDEIAAGGRVVLSIGEFWDEYGEAPHAGGLFAVEAPTPLVLVELQTGDDQPLIGLITIRAEPVRQIAN